MKRYSEIPGNGKPLVEGGSTRDERPVEAFYSGAARAFSELYDPEKIHSRKEYPANYFRLRILLERLRTLARSRLIDMGLGEGTPAVRIAGLGLDVCGFDSTARMVELARENFARHGLNPERVILADIEKRRSFQPLLVEGPFDVALCLGVMPHVEDDTLVLRHIRDVLRVGGRAFVSFRNPLFSLFTMNRYTHDFLVNDLLSPVLKEIRDAVSGDLKHRLEMDKPPLRLKTERGEVGYDAIRARFHNPFEIGSLFQKAGFGPPRIYWYHFHPAPPFLENAAIPTERFRSAAVELEGMSQDWRGHFLSSAYLVEAEAVATGAP